MVATLSLAAIAAGQALPMTPAERGKVGARELSSVVDPTRSTTATPQPIFTVDASAGTAEAAASVGFQYGDFTFDGKVSGPINKGTGELIFADLNGLRGAAKVEVGAQLLRWNVVDPAPALLPACRRLADLQHVDMKTVDCSLSNLRKQEAALNVPLVPYIDPGTVLIVGTRYTIGRTDYAFVSPVTLDDASETHTNWSYAIGGAAITRTNWLLGGGYRIEKRSVPGSGPVELCVPLNQTAADVCVEDTVLGAPVRRTSNQAYFELRKFFGPIAISPRLTRDFTRDVTGLDVPLYFLKNTTGGFTGGVRLGWRSDKKGLTVVAFVGQILGLLGVP